jgi:multiple sugar transport system ATP-binding protein
VTTIYVTHDQTEAMTMGDRVAVMRKGLMQQVDVPQRLYEQPANLFVAEFIGSPAMNLVEADLARANGGLVARFGEHSLCLGEQTISDRPSLADYIDRRVVLGIRPEDVEDARLADGAAPESVLSAVIEIREDMGPEVYAYFSLGVPPVRRPDVEEAKREDEAGTQPALRGAAFVGRLGRETHAREGRPIKLLVDTRRLYFFDPDSGAAIERRA